MHAITVLKIFALSQGVTFGAFIGAVLSVASLPVTRDFFPAAMLGLTVVGSLLGLITAAVRLQAKHRHARRHAQT